MNEKDIFVGSQQLQFIDEAITGNIIDFQGEAFYIIPNYDKMEPFLISLASSSDHWLYISSSGGITAGRKNSDNALFPYVNDDKLHENSEFTGNKTIIKVFDDRTSSLWEPFSERYYGLYEIKRNIYKNITSTKIIFEEINYDLKLIFRYGWSTSDKFGFVKFSEIKNFSEQSKKIEILDGIQNVLASGIHSQLQNEFSTLVNGYKKNELIEENGMGIFSLSSLPSDRAQPSESLLATTIFNIGLDVNKVLLSSQQCDKFRKNIKIDTEKNIKGIKSAYFVSSEFEITSDSSKDWLIVAELNQNAGSIIQLNEKIMASDIKSEVEADILLNRGNLRKLISQADGIQLSNNNRQTWRHFSNVLFNIMRGGVFVDSYNIEKHDFVLFVEKANPFVLKAHKDFFDSLPKKILHSELIDRVKKLNDPHFTRLAIEYLPLIFSRRHGDPSRPWNKFAIEIKNDKNEQILNYQGNWRDIFQNWEALALSYPYFLESMIAKFLNNSTADGYNPYRIFRDGFDWEELEPENPWANIGYWGDHQVIYLLKLLELLKEFNPENLLEFLDHKIFSFANVPYRIKKYEEILDNPRDTIEFDFVLNKQLKQDSEHYGYDAKYLKKADNTLVQVNLIEKLLITLLIKVSNFIPGGGIWMNTQRPEWNDANNALVGYGVSMVTLYYIRRYLKFLNELMEITPKTNFEISLEVKQLFDSIFSILEELKEKGDNTLENRIRKEFVDKLGKAASDYRTELYNRGFSDKYQNLNKQDLQKFIKLCIDIIDTTIKNNKREDGLYHSYNILSISEYEMKISNLYEMLEGQVAVLSSGYLSAEESIEVLTSLRNSSLYREDQNSYILYPNKKLPLFINKNKVSPNAVNKSMLLKKLIKKENSDIIYKDIKDGYHFRSDIINSTVLSKKLFDLEKNPDFIDEAKKEHSLILDIYEETFDHKTFTGRANTFYKYEGLGSIYWHMVSKLLLAVKETYRRVEKNAENKNLVKLKNFYFDIKAGIGVEKSPEKYGAFTTDPYSHTPSFAGVQQPGMTGQVKEDIISRFGELGILIHSSEIIINPSLINIDEFTTKPEDFIYYDLSNREKTINCEPGSIVFTFCQVPFIYKTAEKNKIVIFTNEKEIYYNNLVIDKEISRSIFAREGRVEKIEVYLNIN